MFVMSIAVAYRFLTRTSLQRDLEISAMGPSSVSIAARSMVVLRQYLNREGRDVGFQTRFGKGDDTSKGINFVMRTKTFPIAGRYNHGENAIIVKASG